MSNSAVSPTTTTLGNNSGSTSSSRVSSPDGGQNTRRQLNKLKRFLATLQQFGNDISVDIGERVQYLVFSLVVSIEFV